MLDVQGDRHAAPVAFARRQVNVQDPALMTKAACVLVPAFQAERTLGKVLVDLRAELPALAESILVIDDGSSDGTAAVAREAGVTVVRHTENRGKGAALLTGLREASARGYGKALTVDADGQHPASAARELLEATTDDGALVLGVRGLAAAGAPRKNQLSNRISNFFISHFAGKALRDTQCGLRLYPVAKTLALAARGRGYDFEAEILLRAVWANVPIVEVDVEVLYPDDRVTHFHAVRDPWRIVRTVVRALGDKHLERA